MSGPTIGRTSFTAGPDGDTIVHDGDVLSFTIEVEASSFAALQVARQQLLAYPGAGVVPVTWADDANWDGFYVVSRCSVSPPAQYLNTYWARVDIELVRVGGYSSPVVELIVNAVERTPTPTSSQVLVGIPTAAASSWWSYPTTATAQSARVSETGSVTPFTIDASSGAAIDETFQYQVAPADFYDGAATIEFSPTGSDPWYPVVGRQLQSAAPGSVRVGNGLVRCKVSAAAAITVEVYNGTSWEALAQTFTVGSGVISSASAFAVGPVYASASKPRVLVEGVEECVLRVPILGSDTSMRASLDISVRRGNRFVSFQGSGLPRTPVTSGSNVSWVVQASGGSVTHVTTADWSEAIYLTSNDANGNRWVLGSSDATSYDTTDRGIAGNAVDPKFVIGVELDGTSATGVNEWEDLLAQWWAATSIASVVVPS